MNRFWIRIVIWLMEYDIAQEKKRLEHIRHCIAHDEAVLNQWKLRLMGVER